MNAVESMRLDLMGIGLSGDEQTAEKKRLRTLILAAPLRRRFDSDRPDIAELERLQRRFLERRIKFVTTRDEAELQHLAVELIWMNARLSLSQSTMHLRDDAEGEDLKSVGDE